MPIDQETAIDELPLVWKPTPADGADSDYDEQSAVYVQEYNSWLDDQCQKWLATQCHSH